MSRKRLPKLDPPTKAFKVDGVPSGLVELFNDYVEIKANRENKTKAQVLEDMLLPIVTEGITQKWVDRSLGIYSRQQEQIRRMHEEASKNTPEQEP
jgi:hypothetical protein